MPQPHILKISEIFSSIAGEGLRSGEPTIFLRLAGCNLRCAFCDTKFSLVGLSDELPPEAYVTCPKCQTELVVDFRKARKEGEEKPDKTKLEAKRAEQTTQKDDEGSGGSGDKAKKEG